VPYAGDHHAIGRELLAGRCELVWDARQHAPSVLATGESCPRPWRLANLHIHSKRLSAWAWDDLPNARRRRLWRGSRFREEVITGERLQGLAEISLVETDTVSFHRGLERFARECVVVDDWAQVEPAQIDRVSRVGLFS
jgi:hypothetical protein